MIRGLDSALEVATRKLRHLARQGMRQSVRSSATVSNAALSSEVRSLDTLGSEFLIVEESMRRGFFSKAMEGPGLQLRSRRLSSF